MLIKSQKSRVEGQKRTVAVRSYSGSRLLTLSSRLSRRGVTLIELLIVILIISILAALVLGVAAVAMETARQSKSRHTVERLHTLATEFYDTFKTRRVKLRENDPGTKNGIEPQINARFTTNPASRGQALAEARLYAMREMMLMEVPDRWSDVILERVEDFSLSAPTIAPLYLVGRTNLSNAYLRRFRDIFTRTNVLTGATNTPDEIKRNQGAECLYMIVTMACGDGEARSLFAESSIGDSDGDGAPEFLDGWGHPINFLRWAPGFDSQIQLNANTYSGRTDPQWTKDAAKDHDPFDMYRRDSFAFRLVPLIYSPGRNEDSGLNAAPDFVTWRVSTTQTLAFNNSAPFIDSPILTPYVKGSPSLLNDYMGTNDNFVDASKTDTAADNVHNHMLGLR